LDINLKCDQQNVGGYHSSLV